jgi:hypothetical protein
MEFSGQKVSNGIMDQYIVFGIKLIGQGACLEVLIRAI